MNLSDYSDAFIRGIPILVPDASGTMGRNNIEHLYPDSEVHYIEDNGRLVRKFDIEACLHGPNVKSQFLALQAALETPGPATLLHPWLGVILVSIGECHYDITQREAGIVKISIPCTEAGAPRFPSLVSGSGVAIGGLTTSALTAMADVFLKSYTLPRSVITLTTISESLKNVTDQFSTVFQSVENMGQIIKEVSSFSVISSPVRLVSSLNELFRGPVSDDDLINTGLYEGWAGIVKSSSNDPIFAPFDVTTVSLKNRDESLRAIEAFVHGGVLTHFCESVSYTDYTTADQVVRDRKKIIEFQSHVTTTLQAETRAQINDIVTETIEYLSSLQVQLPKIETIKIHDWPVGPLAYQLYGPNTDNQQILIDINQDKNLMLYDGGVEVLIHGG